MSHTPSQPNVLFIMADQHRHDYLGAAGATFLQTPHLDRLAARGVRFAQAITNCPICAPARIGLATGLQPSRLGALDNASYLPRSFTTHYQRFRDHGYRVGCVGKLDLAKPSHYNGRYGDRPCVYGWGFTHPEECEGKMHAGGHPTPIGPYTHYLQERGLLDCFHRDYQDRQSKGWIVGASHDSVLPTEAFEDVYIGRRAAEWIARVPDDFPWYYFVSFVGPHDPFDPPAEYAERYRAANVPSAIAGDMAGKPGWVARRQVGASAEDITIARRQYCGSIQAIDDGVGLILDALQARGQLENTVIVFTSDHGEMLGDHGLFTKGVAYEASLRVPLVVAGPGIEGGRVSDALVELIDLNPTLCQLAGIPQQENLDARSFVETLGVSETLRVSNHRTEAVSAIRNWRCVRTRQHKLIENDNDLPELYDLAQDPDELDNIASQRPALVRELSARLRARFLEGRWLR
jgi:choline-sulfatase